MKIIDCKQIAAEILNEETVKKLKGKTIFAVMKNHNKDNISYLKSIQKTAEKYDVTVKDYTLPQGMSPDALWGCEKLSENVFVLFVGYKENEIRELVAWSKSIPNFLKVLDPPDAPDVVCAVDQILVRVLGKKYGKPIKTTVIGRSELATKCGFLLLKENQTVTFCHTMTENLKECCKDADVIVSFAGERNLIRGDMVKEGAVIISVGCSFANGKLHGDIDLDSMQNKNVWVTPTPGGTGQVCTALLFDYLAEVI